MPRVPIDANTGLQCGPALFDHKPASCYGLACPHRGACRLHAVIGLVDGSCIESCQRGLEWPLFEPVKDV